jgi:hypothetical protein
MGEIERDEQLREYDEQIRECDTNIASIKAEIASDAGVSGKDWRVAGDVMSQLLDAIAFGDMRKQDRLSKKLAGILAKRSTTNELRESLRRWQDTRRKWVDLRQRAERALARENRKRSDGWLSLFSDDDPPRVIAPHGVSSAD